MSRRVLIALGFIWVVLASLWVPWKRDQVSHRPLFIDAGYRWVWNPPTDSGATDFDGRVLNPQVQWDRVIAFAVPGLLLLTIGSMKSRPSALPAEPQQIDGDTEPPHSHAISKACTIVGLFACALLSGALLYREIGPIGQFLGIVAFGAPAVHMLKDQGAFRTARSRSNTHRASRGRSEPRPRHPSHPLA